MKPDYKNFKVNFILQKIQIQKIFRIDYLEKLNFEYEDIARYLNYLLRLEEEMLVWGSRLPAPKMRYLDYMINDNLITFYGDGFN